MSGSLRRNELDTEAIRREIDHIVCLARSGESHVITLGPLLFFSTTSRDAWMLDRSDGDAACLACDGVELPVVLADAGTQLAIEWAHSYRIEGELLAFYERTESGRALVAYQGDLVQAVRVRAKLQP